MKKTWIVILAILLVVSLTANVLLYTRNKKAAGDLADMTQERDGYVQTVKANETKIAGLETDIEGLKSDVKQREDSIAGLEADIAAKE